MGNCIYKLQVEDKVQCVKKEEIQEVEEALKIQESEKKVTTLVKVQESQESQTPNIFNSQGSTNQLKYQKDLSISPDMMVRTYKQKEQFSFHYEIVKKLGQGGFGQVFKVRHIKTKLLRAAKVIKRNSVDDEELLLQETEILKNLDHPNIVRILEIFSDSEHYYIITECLNGGELLDRVKSVTSYNELAVRLYMKQIFSAMVYCHERKVVHRDLKPENIIFDGTEVDSNLKIIDFGASEKMLSKKLTTKIGTPYYLAPEVLSHEGYDEKVDVWSCGVILYILLVGKAPFRGKNLAETIMLAKDSQLDFSGPTWRKISRDVIDLIKQMLEKNPKKRISMAQALDHKWMKINISNPVGFDQNFIRDITQFKGYNKLRVAIYQFVTVQILKKEDQKKLLEMFKKLDKNGDGVLSEEELIQGMVMADISHLQAQVLVKEIIEQLDSNNSGKVDFTEFITASIIQEKQMLKQSLKTAFRLFDLDGNGTISRSEMEEIFGGIEIENDAWQDILKQCDGNKDGLIEEDEFITLLENLQN